MAELKIQLKQTLEFDDFDMSSLIALKQQYWKYDKAEQERWTCDGLKLDDYHVLIYRGRGTLCLPKCGKCRSNY